MFLLKFVWVSLLLSAATGLVLLGAAQPHSIQCSTHHTHQFVHVLMPKAHTGGSLVWRCPSASQLPQPQLHGMAEHSQGCRCIVPHERGVGYARCLAQPAPQLPQTCAYGEVLILLSTQGEDQHIHERMLAQESLGFSWGAGPTLGASRAGGSSWDRRSARVPWGSPVGGCIPRVLGVAECPPPASPFPLVQPAPQCLALISASPQRGH